MLFNSLVHQIGGEVKLQRVQYLSGQVAVV